MYPEPNSREEADWLANAERVAFQSLVCRGFRRVIAEEASQAAVHEQSRRGRQGRGDFTDKSRFCNCVRNRAYQRAIDLKRKEREALETDLDDHESDDRNRRFDPPTQVTVEPHIASVDRIRVPLTLSHEHRDVLVLFFVQGFSHEEISVELGVPVGTVKSRLSRAKTDARQQLELAGITDESFSDSASLIDLCMDARSTETFATKGKQ